MAEKLGLGSVKRFGVRYGRTTKHRLAKIERAQKAPQKCPYCLKLGVKRISVGIFTCPTCKAKFTGKAFTVSTVILTKEEGALDEKPSQEQEEVLEGEENFEDQKW